MSDGLKFVEIPGYADALRREDRLRREAWTLPPQTIAGVRIRPLTWRDVEELAQARNGFFCPWKFESDIEFLGHCAQVVWHLSDCKKPKRGDTAIGSLIVRAQMTRLTRHLANHQWQTVDEVTSLLADTFADSPKGGGSASAGSAIAGGPAYIADTLAAAGYRLTLDEMLDLPLRQLFQLLRLARRRLYGESQTNPSDKLATDYLANLNAQQGAN